MARALARAGDAMAANHLVSAFEYTALDARGRQRKGVLEADSVRQIRQLLRDQGLAPLSVGSARQASGANQRPFRFQRNLSALDRVLATRRLATLIGAGLPVEEALDAIAQQSDKPHVRLLVMGVRSRVLEGRSLAASLGDYPRSFNDLYRSTVAAGEQSGHLDRVLDNLADYSERQFESWRQVQVALFYPLILFALSVAIVAGLLVYVVPDMVRVLDNMGRELPPATRILIASSGFVQSGWWALLLGGAGLGLGWRLLLRQPGLRLARDRLLLRLPVLRRISRASHAARYANTLSILNGSGVPLVEAMDIASEVVANRWLRERLRQATQRVREGSSLRDALEAAGYFPPMLLHMVASGEVSGTLESMLDRVAGHQQAELERLAATLVALFQPAMLLLMGGMVLFIVIALLLPILSMNELV